jgi:sterol desaturase/sphingolipid hydroxylase (fatty acid hydroxylase superfamily)
MNQLVDYLRSAPIEQIAALLLLENVLIFFLALATGRWLVRRFSQRPVQLLPAPVRGAEIALAGSTILLNTVVTVAGLALWRAGVVQFRADVGLWAWLDVPVLLLLMDGAMYALHRLAHTPLLFPLMHRTHHRYERVRPLTLFLLSPIENLGFGLLWLLVIALYHPSWLGMSIYLAINVAFGTVGHLGVEPLPDSWHRLPVLSYLSTSTFHAQHHQELDHNYGFYTLLWDKLFGTLSPRYEKDFGRVGRQPG